MGGGQFKQSDMIQLLFIEDPGRRVSIDLSPPPPKLYFIWDSYVPVGLKMGSCTVDSCLSYFQCKINFQNETFTSKVFLKEVFSWKTTFRYLLSKWKFIQSPLFNNYFTFKLLYPNISEIEFQDIFFKDFFNLCI